MCSLRLPTTLFALALLGAAGNAQAPAIASPNEFLSPETSGYAFPKRTGHCSNALENGGFESGTDHWKVKYGKHNSFIWKSTPWSGQLGAGTVGSTWTGFPSDGYTVDVAGLVPYIGSSTLCMNDPGGGKHITRVSQKFCLKPPQGMCDTEITFKWGAIISDPHGHTPDQQPYFRFSVRQDTETLAAFNVTGDQVSGDPLWTVIGQTDGGTDIYYRSDTEALSVDASKGELVAVEMEVGDCSLGGHGAAAFLDGVTISYSQSVNVPIPPFGIPTGFTPNGDGVNDAWGPTGLADVLNAEFEIFDRWGNKIVDKHYCWPDGNVPVPLDVWDGKVNGVLQEVGEYLYRGRVWNCSHSEDIPLGPFFLVN